jgi:hypothetical protein
MRRRDDIAQPWRPPVERPARSARAHSHAYMRRSIIASAALALSRPARPQQIGFSDALAANRK